MTSNLDNLWELYRKFVLACRQAGMTDSAPEFFAWLENRKFTDAWKPTCHETEALKQSVLKAVLSAQPLNPNDSIDTRMEIYNEIEKVFISQIKDNALSGTSYNTKIVK